MSLLGTAAALTVATDDVVTALDTWEDCGFFDAEGPDGVVSDGQIIVRITEDAAPSLRLTYTTGSVERVAQKLRDRGVPYVLHGSALEVEMPGGVVAEVLHHDLLDLPRISHEGNGELGYLEALAIHVEDIQAARAWGEKAGFFLIEEFGEPAPQCDMTDGLMRISWRASALTNPTLVYEGDITEGFRRFAISPVLDIVVVPDL